MGQNESPETDPVNAANWFLAKEHSQHNCADLFCSEFSDPYLMSVHVMQLMSRLFVVIRFKATDVSLSEVGCAPHLKKNSWKNEKYDHRQGIRPAMYPLNMFTVKNLFGRRRVSSVYRWVWNEITSTLLREINALGANDSTSPLFKKVPSIC